MHIARRAVHTKCEIQYKGVFILANLTAKELSAIEDQLGLEQNLVKKFQSMAKATTDKQLQTKWNQIAAKHQQHYAKLLGHLN